MIDVPTLYRFEALLKAEATDLKVLYKDESLFMRFIGLLLSPFNESFMKVFSTTFGSTVYFPSRAFFEGNPLSNLILLAHEFVHVWDNKRSPLFSLSYAFPQFLAVIPLAAYGYFGWPYSWIPLLAFGGYILACLMGKVWKGLFWVLALASLAGPVWLGWHFTHWNVLYFAGALTCLAPWPAPWRAKWELRAYNMNTLANCWIHGEVTDAYFSWLRNFFVGSPYYFMRWDGKGTDKAIVAIRQEIEAAKTTAPYSILYKFLADNQLLSS